MEPTIKQQTISNTNPNPYNANNTVGYSQQPLSTAPVRSKRSFSFVENVYAWLSLLFGYLFCRVFPIADSPFGGLLFTLMLFISAFVVIKIKGSKIGAKPIIVALSAIIISATLIITSNAFLHFFSYAYSLVIFCYFVYSALGNSVKSGFSDLIVADFLKALFVLPFCSFGYMFRALFSGKAKGSGKVFLKVLIGIAIAIVPTIVVFVLLSYDNNFIKLINNIFDFNLDEFWSHIGSLILGVPIGLYIYGLFISSVDKKCKNVLNEDSCRKVINSMRIAPVATIIAATAPVLFLYVVFFISQWKYYVSGFTGVLPDDFSYADYAREGFFQLCTVSVINLILILAVILFIKADNKLGQVLNKIVVILFSLSTLILISTAISKMAMYINTYGLTPKRVYATWLMLLIALIFLIISVRQFVVKLKAVAVSLVVTVIMFSFVALPNVDGIIAKYNVGRYLEGSLLTVDIDAMEELGSSAIPSLIVLAKPLENKGRSKTLEENSLYNEVTQYLNNVANEIKESEKDIFSFTLPDAMAEKALKEYGYLEQ